MLSLQQCATLACLMDVTIPKPGNVHRGADFEDMTFWDFAKSAIAIGPVMSEAPGHRIGETALAAIRATREVTRANTNLGIVLLMTPLAKVAGAMDRPAEIERVMQGLTAYDAQQVYEAIRSANPGGLGSVDDMDIRGTPPDDLLAAMWSASGRDLIARQYVTGFTLLLEDVVPQLVERCRRSGLLYGVIDTFLWLMSWQPDSLIARKCGGTTAQMASDRAAQVLEAAELRGTEYEHRLADFDFWLRADKNKRNPGTTADMITAALFVCLSDDLLDLQDPLHVL